MNINWTTSEESNVDHFVLQRQIDAEQDWTNAAIISAGRTSDATKQYAYTERNVTGKRASFRLVSVDRDNVKTIHPSTSISMSCQPNVLRIFPTATYGSVQVNLPHSLSEQKFSLHDMSGRKHPVRVTHSTGAATIDVSSLPLGTYLLSIASMPGNAPVKVVKLPAH